jgi:thiamine-phosphate pyrophosphorylase
VAAAAGWAPMALLDAFIAGGATLIQLRAKQLPSGPFLELCDAAVERCAGRGARVIVNDRVDLAVLSKAAGAHIGQDDLNPGDARAQLGPLAILGRSTHDETQITGAALEPVSYIAVGPIFGSNTKATGYQAVGLDLVRAARRLAPAFPIVAIGGITLDNARAVIDAGATAVAVIGDLVAGGDPAARIASYNRLAPARPGG